MKIAIELTAGELANLIINCRSCATHGEYYVGVPLHPQSRLILDQMAAAGGPPMEQLTPQEMRADRAAKADAMAAACGPVQEVARVESRTFRDRRSRFQFASIGLRAARIFRRSSTIMAAAGSPVLWIAMIAPCPL